MFICVGSRIECLQVHPHYILYNFLTLIVLARCVCKFSIISQWKCWHFSFSFSSLLLVLFCPLILSTNLSVNCYKRDVRPSKSFIQSNIDCGVSTENFDDNKIIWLLLEREDSLYLSLTCATYMGEPVTSQNIEKLLVDLLCTH